MTQFMAKFRKILRHILLNRKQNLCQFLYKIHDSIAVAKMAMIWREILLHFWKKVTKLAGKKEAPKLHLSDARCQESVNLDILQLIF